MSITVRTIVGSIESGKKNAKKILCITTPNLTSHSFTARWWFKTFALVWSHKRAGNLDLGFNCVIDCIDILWRQRTHNTESAWFMFSYIYPVHVCARSRVVFGRVSLCIFFMWPKTSCLRSYCLKISHWCNTLLAH